MKLNSFQALAKRTAGAGQDDDTRLITSALGLAGEAGEFANMVKKMTAHGHPLDKDKLSEELGDVMWYVAEAATTLGLLLSDIGEDNIDKLRKRYPEGFSEERSRNREEAISNTRNVTELPEMVSDIPSIPEMVSLIIGYLLKIYPTMAISSQNIGKWLQENYNPDFDVHVPRMARQYMRSDRCEHPADSTTFWCLECDCNPQECECGNPYNIYYYCAQCETTLLFMS